MPKIILNLLLLFIAALTPSALAGTAFCRFEHTSRYQSDLLTDEITGYMCNLDLDIKGDRVNDVGGYHEGGERDSQVDIIKVLPDYYSYFTSFPKTFCSRFNKLEIIDMSRAEIKTIEADSLEKCKDLRILQFYMNKFNRIPENLLSNNQKLLKVFITFNSKLRILPKNLFSGLEELQLLDLSYNIIDHLPNGIFEDNNDLKELNLEANNIADLETGLFEKLTNLKILKINDNQISDLSPDIFANLANLKTLHLQSNKLTIIHADAFPQQANIDMVALNKNKINAIDEGFIDNCEVSNLKMGGNVCDKTSLIRKKDIKARLTKCFTNYENINPTNVERPTTPKPITSTTEATTTTTLSRTRSKITTSTTTVKPATTTTTTIKPTTTTTSKTQTQKLESYYGPCGIAKAAAFNMIRATEIAKGSHPWIAALIHKTEGYFCGGTLYTTRLVVTAAHCIKKKDTKEKEASDISVLLGADELDNPNEQGRKKFSVESIHIHNAWNPHTIKYDADIAVLKLSGNVTFGTWIQPVCIAKFNAPLSYFKTGIVVGFGKTEKAGTHSNVPMKANTPIRESDDCYNEYPSLIKIASHKTFCGGFANGTGACTGDSGGGLTVVQDDVHYLRGIVSASLHGTDYGCNVESYSIFTDVKFFLPFMKNI
ncbi:hypothetical protein ACKWTF_014277 [Chironomus riparius]